jgi:sugar-specific transcriptional regulator TrmB
VQSLSHEQVFQIFKSFGLSQADAQVYVFLAKEGVMNGKELSEGLGQNRNRIYRALKRLREKGIVEEKVSGSTRLSAVPFNKLIELYLESKKKEMECIRKTSSGLYFP